MSKKDKKSTEETAQKANCFIEEDLYQKVKREAKHLGIPPQKLINSHLRDYFNERNKSGKKFIAADQMKNGKVATIMKQSCNVDIKLIKL